MADEKNYTEAEHIAILSDRVATETASLNATVTELTSVKTELENKLDVAEGEKVAAEQRATEAENALAEFKAQVDSDREAAARKETRLAAAREAAQHLPEEFFADEKRVARIVAMSEEGFEGYLADLGATNTANPVETGAPRETAMTGNPVQPQGEPSKARSFFLRNYTPVEG